MYTRCMSHNILMLLLLLLLRENERKTPWKGALSILHIRNCQLNRNIVNLQSIVLITMDLKKGGLEGGYYSLRHERMMQKNFAIIIFLDVNFIQKLLPKLDSSKYSMMLTCTYLNKEKLNVDSTFHRYHFLICVRLDY